MDRIDVVWKIGAHAPEDFWELRYSMRAFRENFTQCGQFWIIGVIPDWIDRSRVRCIEFPDPHQHSKDANLIAKLLRLSFEPELSERFIYSSDDQFPLAPGTEWRDFGPFCSGDLWAEAEWKPSSHYARVLRATGRALWARRLPTLKFDSHIPMPYEKARLHHLLEWDFGTGIGYAIHSLYCNSAGIAGRPLPVDYRAWIHSADAPSAEATAELLDASRFAAFMPDGMSNQSAVAWLRRRFSTPGDWELDRARPLTPACVASTPRCASPSSMSDPRAR